MGRTSYYVVETSTGWLLGYRDTWVREEKKARPFRTRLAATRAKAKASDTPDGKYPATQYRNGIVQ